MRILVHRIFSFTPGKPRHPVLRVLCGLLGVTLLALLVVFGLFIGLGMLLFAAIRRMTRKAPAIAPSAPADVIEGEYSVVDKPRPSLGMR